MNWRNHSTGWRSAGSTYLRMKMSKSRVESTIMPYYLDSFVSWMIFFDNKSPIMSINSLQIVDKKCDSALISVSLKKTSYSDKSSKILKRFPLWTDPIVPSFPRRAIPLSPIYWSYWSIMDVCILVILQRETQADIMLWCGVRLHGREFEHVYFSSYWNQW